MREKNFDKAKTNGIYCDDIENYSDGLNLAYCVYRLNSLANKIKSDYLKIRKQEIYTINP